MSHLKIYLSSQSVRFVSFFLGAQALKQYTSSSCGDSYLFIKKKKNKKSRTHPPHLLLSTSTNTVDLSACFKGECVKDKLD